jgi:outer membrane biosynthesis protein TonB
MWPVPGPQEQTEAKRKVVTKGVPIYPELARKMRIMGSVRIEVIVSPDGSSKTIRVIGGHPLLAHAPSVGMIPYNALQSAEF